MIASITLHSLPQKVSLTHTLSIYYIRPTHNKITGKSFPQTQRERFCVGWVTLYLEEERESEKDPSAHPPTQQKKITMKPTARRLLASATSSPRGPVALLPPIPLYRRLLRAHRRHLPQEMRLLGDEYVKAEFRAHRNVDNPAHMVCFVLCFSFSLSVLYVSSLEGGFLKGEWRERGGGVPF